MQRQVHMLILVLALLVAQPSCRPILQSAPVSGETSLTVKDNAGGDSLVKAMIAPYKAKLDAEMKRPIGISERELRKGPVESELGNLVADLMHSMTALKTGRAIDIAVVTTGGLRTTLKEGEITVGDVFELMPFDNEICLLSINATQVRSLFDFLARGQNVAVSNSMVRIGEDKQVREIQIGGKPIGEGKTYTLCISDYLANGGDRMEFLMEIQKEMTGYLVRDAIIDHIEGLGKRGELVTAKLDGRVIIGP